MRWFESAYGAHTLAAIIHDDLIVEVPNGGPLEDDTLSDRFFREMMKSAGVPWLKRWIMWSAVALRSRWAVGGIRRLSVLVWLILSATGITSFVWALGSATLGWDGPLDTWALLLVALVLPFVAAFLWGEAVRRRHRRGDRRALDPARRRPRPVSATSCTSASNGPQAG